jgi:hypothetical protein
LRGLFQPQTGPSLPGGAFLLILSTLETSILARTLLRVHVILYLAVHAILTALVPPLISRGTQEIRHQTTTSKLLLTFEELEVLLPLASDQLFRNEFIDIRFSGFERNREKVQSAKAVIIQIKERLQQAQQGSGDALRLSIPIYITPSSRKPVPSS